MKVLFSPVGMTDPIRFFKDGALLNICRNYLPDKIYLYMSKEVLVYHNKDDRYRFCLERLGEHIGKTLEIELIERPELEDVQIFDGFITEYREELTKIHTLYPDAEILLNVSSGTPAMKSSLQILSLTMNFRTTPIQVSSPQKSSNPRIDEEKDLTPEEHWELNESNDAEDNRCIASPTKSLLEEFEKQNVIKLIRSYDYAAAYAIAKDSEIFSDKFKELLLAAASRLKLETKAKTIFKKYNISDIFTNEKHKDFSDIEEYLLLLKIKILKEEYADFMRNISPAIYILFETYLSQKCGIDLSLYTYTNNKEVTKWDAKKLSGTKLLDILNKGYNNGFDVNSYVKTDALYKIIEYYSHSTEAIDIADKLRNRVEERLRNKAAHTIISITDKKIKDVTTLSSNEIYDLLVKMLELCGYRLNENSYDKMNDIIISEI